MTGAVYIYEDFDRTGTWNQTQKLISPDVGSDEFGISVMIQNETMVIGGWLNDNSKGANAGAFIWQC